MKILHDELIKIGLTSVIVNTNTEKNMSEWIADNPTTAIATYEESLAINKRAVVHSIDWHFSRDQIIKDKQSGIITIGMVDGIEDFQDADYPFIRDAYRTVEYVLLMGFADQQFLQDRIEKTSIVGLPKLWKLHTERKNLPDRPKVMLNVNFTYGIFESERADWVKKATNSCSKLGVDFVISQHHADNGTFPRKNISQKNVYETINESSIVISRFSTVIIEALAMGRQVIYFNPHGEKVKCYSHSLGAFQTCYTAEELDVALNNALNTLVNFEINSNVLNFLDVKANLSSKIPPGQLAAHKIKTLLTERDGVELTQINSYKIDKRYTSRSVYHHYDDLEAKDEWQLEVYLFALGLMHKYNLSKVADFGCGSGFKLMTYFSQYDTVGYELPVNIKELNLRYPRKNWQESSLDPNIRQIDTDVLICSDVIEHLINPDDLLNYFKSQNFKFLVLSTPAKELVYAENDPYFFGPPRNLAHQREWTMSEFKSYIGEHFEIIDHRISNHDQATQIVICKKFNPNFLE